MAPLGQETGIEAFDLLGDERVVAGRIVVGLHINHIGQVVEIAVAQGIVAAQEHARGIDGRKIDVHLRAHVDHGANLQQIEHTTAVFCIDFDGELDLHRSTHGFFAHLQHLAHDLRERHDVVLQDADETDDFSPAGIQAGIDHLVGGIECRGDELQRAVGIGHFDGQAQEIEAVVHREVLAHVLQVEGAEARLRFAQRHLGVGRLQHARRMSRTDAQRAAAVHNIFAQAEGETHRALFGALVVEGIVIERAPHARNVGIEVVAVAAADHFLQHHGHFLLVDHIARGLHVGLRVLEIDRSIHAFDGIAKHGEHAPVVVEIGHHVGVVDAGKRLVMAVFEQRTGAHRHGTTEGIDKSEEVAFELFGQTGATKGIENRGVVDIRQSQLVEIVRLHELLEKIGAEHHRFGDHDGGVVETVDFGVVFHQIVDEGQTASLAAERTFADAGEIGVPVEAIAAEHGDHAAVLHQTVLHNGFKDDAAMRIEVAQFFPRELFHKLGGGKERTAAEPARNVVARDVIEQRIGRNGEDGVLHLLEIARAGHLFERAGVTKHEIAEAEMLFHGATQIDGHLF